MNDQSTPENPFFLSPGRQNLAAAGDPQWKGGRTGPRAHGRGCCPPHGLFPSCRRVREFYRRCRAKEPTAKCPYLSVFSRKARRISSLFAENSVVPPEPEGRAQEDFDSYGRNPAFRRKVLEVYDYQCAACGLRIKLPDASLTFVDGAHLIPFGISRNDHPTNGIALCKTITGPWIRFSLFRAQRECGKPLRASIPPVLLVNGRCWNSMGSLCFRPMTMPFVRVSRD